MLDGEGRDIRYLRLSVTDLCNCRCLYCMPAQGVPKLSHEQILSFEELERIVRAAAGLGITKLRITGGEPLVRKGIVDLVGRLAAVEGIEEVAMTTNALRLAPLAADLKAAGLDRLNVSLDTLDPDRYRTITRRGSLEDALEGLRAARKAGLGPTKVNCVLMGGVNTDEIPRLAALAREGAQGDLGVASVRFIELMPMGECACWPRERFVPADVVLRALPGLVPLAPAAGAARDESTCGPTGAPGDQGGVAQLYRMEGWRGTVGLIHPMSHRFCADCNRIRVTADGRLKPCLHSAAEISLRGLSDRELRQTMAAAISAKPKRHHMDATHASESLRAMNEIGG